MKPPEPPRFYIGCFFVSTIMLLISVMKYGNNFLCGMLFAFAIVFGIICEKWRQDYDRWWSKQRDEHTS